MTAIDQAQTVTVHEGAGPLPAAVLRLLDGWLPGRRWFPVPAEGLHHVPWLTVEVPDVPGVLVPLLRLAGPGQPQDESAIVIQVPLVLVPVPGGRRRGERAAARPAERARKAGLPATGPGLIGVVDTGDGALAVHDGGVHPAAWRAYLAAALAPADADPALDALEGARPLGGEQSNTSVLVPDLRPPVPGFPGERARGAILKILRTVPLGPHPDVVIPEALTRAGWAGVPRFLGAVGLPAPPSADPVPGQDPAPVAHLAVVSELVDDADDGFELACAHAREGLDFDEHAAELGAVVAHLHTALATARPTDATLDPAGFMGVLRRRAAEAIADVPDLAPQRAGITGLYDEVSTRLTEIGTARPVPLQAIHGDLHLGQVLHARSGWKVLDFEGEPQRPVTERTAPDLPLRDVAGLLRSFDYAAAVGGAEDPEWSARAQVSFLEGYRQALTDARTGAAGGPPGPSPHAGDAVPGAAVPGGALDVTTAALLLRALTLDKALYEVVYEARHRPAWLHIPLGAVSAVLGR
ncbi:hypothetical protein GCM10028784_14130 [Myceligenerans cantabricum]